MSAEDQARPADELAAATSRLEEIAAAIRDRNAEPEQLAALAEEAARLAAEVASAIGQELRGGDT